MLRDLLFRLRALLRPHAVERELDEELRFHLDRQVQAYRKAGAPHDEAVARARTALGGLDQVKDDCREARGVSLIETTARDLRYAGRSLRRNPGFTAVALLTLALGMGANTALFSVVYAVLLQPLPYPESERLVRIRETCSVPDYRLYRNENDSLVALGAYHNTPRNLTGVDLPERLMATHVTASLWSVLSVRPLLGDLFSREAEHWGQHRLAVLSETLWQRRFGADPNVIGREVRLDEEAYTIIGVMPRWFQFPSPSTDVWMPVSFPPNDVMETRSNYFLNVLGRLKPDMTIQQAHADLSVIAAQIVRDLPETAGLAVTLVGLQDSLVGDVRVTLLLLVGAVGFVLLIACANVANLLLARAGARQRELTVRIAFGASKARLIRQLFAESLVLASLGAAVGGGLAYVAISLLPHLADTGVPRLDDVSLNSNVLGFTAALAMATALLFGLWPAWRATHTDVSKDLSASARSVSGGRAHSRVRHVLIVAEVSLSLVLLVGAALLILSLARVQQVDPGFRPDHLLTMHISLPSTRYSEPEQIVRFVDRALAGVEALPDVSATGVTTSLPLGSWNWEKLLTIEGRPLPSSMDDVPRFSHRQVTPDYFRALRMTLRRGRLFTTQDAAGQPGVAIVNETLARRFWRNDSPVGQRIRLGPPEPLIAHLLTDYPGGAEAWRASMPWLTIVGVVGDVRHRGLEQDVNAEVFIPHAQGAEETSGSFYLVARTATEPLRRARAVQAVIQDVDPDQPVAEVRAMEARLGESLARRRFTLFLLGSFAGMALLLTLVGLYGVMTYNVSQRRKELAIRSALGAKPPDLLRLVLGYGVRLATLGVVIGLVLAASLSRLLSSHLFAVHALDPRVFAATALTLLACAALACWVAGRAAARADPATTLREG